eukprot:3899341-Prorocentrum_lima.AAC.1
MTAQQQLSPTEPEAIGVRISRIGLDGLRVPLSLTSTQCNAGQQAHHHPRRGGHGQSHSADPRSVLLLHRSCTGAYFLRSF